jgi:murein lipoprotein
VLILHYEIMDGGTMIQNSKIRPVLMLAVLLGLTGCASSTDFDALRASVQQANQTANSAAAKADAASREAAAASKEAAAAKQQSASASQIANEAKAGAQEVNSKIDRMFKKSMYK